MNLMNNTSAGTNVINAILIASELEVEDIDSILDHVNQIQNIH